MADIFHSLSIRASKQMVFQAVATSEGLDRWWTKRSSGKLIEGGEYELRFEPEIVWHAIVIRCVPGNEFELQISNAHIDWIGTCVGFSLSENDGITQVQFHHTGWPDINENYRVACYCWATNLRLLRRYLEYGEVVPQKDRNDV